MDLSLEHILKILFLLLTANGTPILAKRALGGYWATPLDAGKVFFDSQPILGVGKTWRGLLIGIAVTALVATILGFTWQIGALFGALSLAGDIISSFIKRRIKIQTSGKALCLDQIPEALLPLWVLREPLNLELWSIVTIVIFFIIGELILSKVLFKAGIRDHPY